MHGEVNIHTKFQVDVRGDSMIGANIESGDTLTVDYSLNDPVKTGAELVFS